MTIVLERLSCAVVAGSHAATLVGGTQARPPSLEVAAEDGRIIWRFAEISLGTPPERHAPSVLSFEFTKRALLGQLDRLPPAQAERSVDYGLAGPMTGEERWGGRSRAVSEPIGRFHVSRVFVACPQPAGFVADTGERPTLALDWTPSGDDGTAALSFHAELSFDPMPDRRWTAPVLELEMPHTTYANVRAALESVR